MTTAETPPSHGQFVWYELSSPDLAASKAFYKAVLGWDAASPPGGSAYTFFLSGGVPVAGLNFLPEDARRMGASPQWTGYVAVDDVDQAARRVKELGGGIFIPPSDIPGVSRFSVVADAEGANLVLVKGLGQGGPKSSRDVAGRVIWHELVTSRPGRAFAYYTALLSWQKADEKEFPLSDYLMFSDGIKTVGGIASKPEDWRRAFWRYYFHVTGIETATKRVQSAGGKVFEEPYLLPSGVWVVHCADPSGAVFSLMDTAIRVVIGCYSPRNQSKKSG